MIHRRAVVRLVATFLAWAASGRRVCAASLVDDPRMRALAGAVLPSEIGRAGLELEVGRFLKWLRDYRPDADLDHEYGSSKLGRASPSPSGRYAADLDDLDRRCGGDFGAVSLAAQQLAVAAALGDAGVEDLPERPDGGHVATDLMAYFFNGAMANDLAYRRSIGRFDCRGLGQSELRPPPLAGP